MSAVVMALDAHVIDVVLDVRAAPSEMLSELPLEDEQQLS